MKARTAQAVWKGDLKSGNGVMNIPNLGWKGNYTFKSRFDEGEGTNPEELIAAAHAGCFSMAFANTMAGKGYDPKSVETEAQVHLTLGEKGFYISSVHLVCQASVEGIDNDTFQALAEEAKKNCPVSKALAAIDISVEAKLV